MVLQPCGRAGVLSRMVRNADATRSGEGPVTITRRKLLHLAATAVPALALPGCTWARVHARCRDWGVEPEGPLAIDAHAHFFNASDLPVSGFVQRVLLKSGSPAVESISDILRDLVWSAAPNGEEELQLLGALSRELAACPADAVPLLVRKKRQERY